MGERKGINLINFLQEQQKQVVQRAGETLIAATQTSDFQQLDAEVMGVKSQLADFSSIGRTINFLSEQIALIKAELSQSGATIPDNFELELTLVWDEKTREEKTPATPIPQLLPEEKEALSFEAKVKSLAARLPENLSLGSLEFNFALLIDWQNYYIPFWQRRMRLLSFGELSLMPEGKVRRLIPQSLPFYEAFLPALEDKVKLWQQFEEGQISRDDLGRWQMVEAQIELTEGIGQGQTLDRETYDLSIKTLNLSQRVCNCLMRMRLVTIGSVLSTSEEELKELRNFGAKSLAELKGRLAENGHLPQQ